MTRIVQAEGLLAGTRSVTGEVAFDRTTFGPAAVPAETIACQVIRTVERGRERTQLAGDDSTGDRAGAPGRSTVDRDRARTQREPRRQPQDRAGARGARAVVPHVCDQGCGSPRDAVAGPRTVVARSASVAGGGATLIVTVAVEVRPLASVIV